MIQRRPTYAVPQHKQQSGLAKAVMKMGLAKDAKSAQRVLLIVALLAFAATAFIIWPKPSPEPTAQELRVMEAQGILPTP